MDKQKVVEIMASLEDAFKENSLALVLLLLEELEKETSSEFAMKCLVQLTVALEGNVLADNYFMPLIEGVKENASVQ